MNKLFEAVDSLDSFTLNESEIEFSGVAFEKSLPHEMRFKNWDEADDGSSLYWVTQQHYTEDQLREFAEALKNTEFRKAYVTVRDNSTYEWADDNQHGVLDIITIDGDGNANIESCGKNQLSESEEVKDEETTELTEEPSLKDLATGSEAGDKLISYCENFGVNEVWEEILKSLLKYVPGDIVENYIHYELNDLAESDEPAETPEVVAINEETSTEVPAEEVAEANELE